MPSLSRPEVYRVVSDYIGGSGGYLGDFSYRTHAEFYPAYCDLDVDPYAIPGTTRDRFIQILSTELPEHQARIIRGVLQRFPVGSEVHRTHDLAQELLRIVRRLEGDSVGSPQPRVTNATVEAALRDAEILIREHNATSAVDRVHTALHGYLKAVCDEAGLGYPEDASLSALFRLVREGHKQLLDIPFADEINRILRSFSGALDALGTLRNNASIAHPNDDLLPEQEAWLAINATRTIFHYLDSKLG